jgi:hypothetical protein
MESEASVQSSSESTSSEGDNKGVRKVASGEAALRSLFQDGKRAEVTIVQYVNSLRFIHQLVTGKKVLPPTLDWIKSVDITLEKLSEKYANSGTFCNKLTPLMVVAHSKGWKDVHKRYFEIFSRKKSAQMKDAEQQKATAREAANWISMDELKSKAEELNRQIRRSIMPTHKNCGGSNLSRDEIKVVFQHLLLAFNILEPPKRRDLSTLPLQKADGSFFCDEAREAYMDTGNCLRESTSGDFVLVLKTYKTSKRYGRKEFELSQRLSNYIKRSIELVPRGFVLSRLGNTSEAMSDNYLTKFCGSITFLDGRRLNQNHLRHLYISEQFANDHSIAERKQLAERMLHDWGTAMLTYERK